MLPKLFFISLLLSSFIFTTHSSYTQCVEHEKRLLLQFKNELIFNSSLSTKLVKWNRSEECCKWYGVECDAAGYVVRLQLDHEAISGGIGDSSSLFRLEHLQKLNLAYNYFNGSQIPRGIHNLTNLTHLNLSYAGFVGQLPLQISFLKRLVSLDVSNEVDWATEPLKLENPSLQMLPQNLTGLRELYLDGVKITSSDERRKLSHIISSSLPDLTTLSLAHCGLSGPVAESFWKLHSLSALRLDHNDLSAVVPDSFASFPSLTNLSLVSCSLKGSFPNMIFHIPTLQNLDLSMNFELSGSIPPFTQSGSLKSVVLSQTNLSGLIPSSVSNLKTLSRIDLSLNKFTGLVPSTFANLTQLTHVDLSFNFFTGSLPSTLFEGLSSLVYLNLDYNSFSGNIPLSLFGLPSVSRLHLSNNQFTGLVEEFPVVNVSNIVLLDLSNNRLEGPIPNFLFQLHSLEFLLLSSNLFSDTFQLDKIQRLANLTLLDLSHNSLSIDAGSDNSSTHELLRLQVLRLASCNMYAFPDFIKHSDMRELDLSNNRIVGAIPSWIWGNQLESLNLSLNLLTHLQKPYHIPSSLKILDLQSNQLKGELNLLIPPNITSKLEYLLLANNYFSGSIPASLCSATDLYGLDLSVNKLGGSIPPCLLGISMITVLNLGQNNISGRIPDNFSLNCDLEYFDLSNNNLEGKIPKSLESCTELAFMNVGNNMINDTFPCMQLSGLQFLVLRSNKFHGEVRCHNNLPNLQILDISLNHFYGSLESINFSSWRKMVIRNDARPTHNISGFYSLWSTIGVTLIMKGLELDLHKIWSDFSTIDLSSNNFSGKIPNAIGELSSLHHLNLSHNALNGIIPKSFGQLGELESLDLSRNELTGSIPVELTGLTFLSVLNLSYNELVGEIPNGRQLQTFSADSFRGNPRLCGFNLNISCTPTTVDGSGLSPGEDENEEEQRDIEWEYVSAALGYVVGLGSIVWLLLFRRSFREKYFGKIEDVVEDIFNARDMRRKRARRAVRDRRNQVRRQ